MFDIKYHTKMQYYDKIAQLYDFFTIWIYKTAREKLIEDLKIKERDRILIIACGTGQSFKLIEEKIGSTGEIIALDYSTGMLAIAQKNIEKNNWKNVKLLNIDARKLSIEYLNKNNIKSNFDIIIGELAFSVIPEWKKIMRMTFSLLKTNGKIGLLDWYIEKNDWLTKIIDFLAEANTNRNTPKFAKEIFNNFRITNKFFLGNVYIGIGKK